MDKIQRHKELCEKLNKVYEQKNEKYGDSFGTSIQKYGMIAALTRISDKFHRFEQLVLAKEDGSDTDESIVDTCLDAANYFLMTVIEMENDKSECDKRFIGYPKDFITTTSLNKEISNITEKDNNIDLWEVAKDMAKPIQLDWTYTDDRHTSNFNKKISNIKEDEKINSWKTVEDMASSIKPEWTYNPKHEFTNI